MGILVTGGAGYIGSVAVELFREHGEEVVVLDNLSRGHVAAVPAGVVFYKGDVGDRQLVQRIAREHEIEACVHFAALAYVGESVSDPALYYDNNVASGIAMLETLRAMGVTVAKLGRCPCGCGTRRNGIPCPSTQSPRLFSGHQSAQNAGRRA